MKGIAKINSCKRLSKNKVRDDYADVLSRKIKNVNKLYRFSRELNKVHQHYSCSQSKLTTTRSRNQSFATL
jgi:hypothetical protein